MMDIEQLLIVRKELMNASASITSLYYGIGRVLDGDYVELFIRIRDSKDLIQEAVEIIEKLIKEEEDGV